MTTISRIADLEQAVANLICEVGELCERLDASCAPKSMTVRLERRSRPEQLRYLASKLGEDNRSVSVALSLEVIADEIESETTA